MNPGTHDPKSKMLTIRPSVRFFEIVIMKTRLFKYIENFTTKNWKFSDKNFDIFLFLLKT